VRARRDRGERERRRLPARSRTRFHVTS